MDDGTIHGGGPTENCAHWWASSSPWGPNHCVNHPQPVACERDPGRADDCTTHRLRTRVIPHENCGGWWNVYGGVSYPYTTRAAALEACQLHGCAGLATRAEVVAKGQNCFAQWTSEGAGYFMESVASGCGHKGWNFWSGAAAAACSRCPDCQTCETFHCLEGAGRA